MRPNNRPAIARRSCDPCRARKIGCDRASPCSNCRSARIECTHSAVARREVTSTPRLSLSTQYERKLDDIASDIQGIKAMLQGHASGQPVHPANNPTPNSIQEEHNEPQTTHHISPLNNSAPRWDHSAHIVEFVKAVVEGPIPSSESSRVISSLRNLVNALEDENTTYSLSSAEKVVTSQTNAMPSADSVADILDWAKAHAHYTKLAWICNILPLDMFEETCRRACLAADCSQIDFIIANGFLSYVFAEHVALYGNEISRASCELCRSNLGNAFMRLPLLLPASMETIAALTLGALYSIEVSKAMNAWTLVSTALSHCQTLGYHRLGAKRGSGALQVAQGRLFWTVYSFESGLSLRLGRSSGIQDTDIVTPIDPDEARYVKVARIQKRVYNQLYSAAAQSLPAETRNHSVQTISTELRDLIENARAEVSETADHLGDSETDAMKVIYLYGDIVCESSLLVLILRAMPTPQGADASEECVAAARDTLDMHQHCMELVRNCRDPLLVTKYISWAILHTPFVPFSILFTRAAQLSDTRDLARLDAFAYSLKPQVNSESLTHPFRLYELLCQAARLYIDSKPKSPRVLDDSSPWMDRGHISGRIEEDTGTFQPFDNSISDLGEWYYSNQQLMSLLDDDIVF